MNIKEITKNKIADIEKHKINNEKIVSCTQIYIQTRM